MFQRILVSLDGSAHAMAAIEPTAHLITALAAPAQSVIHLVQVVKHVATECEEKDLEGWESAMLATLQA